MGKGRVENDKKIEDISLEIVNHWTSNDFLTETNKNCGTLVAFDVVEDNITEINTNIDLGELESRNFKYDDFIDFLKRNNFTFVLGLRNISCSENNPSTWDWDNLSNEILDVLSLDIKSEYEKMVSTQELRDMIIQGSNSILSHKKYRDTEKKNSNDINDYNTLDD